jgi:hypothetical protein
MCSVSWDELLETVKQTIDAGKSWISIFWSFSGIHDLIDIAQGMAHHTTLFCDQIARGVIADIRAHVCRKMVTRSMIHVANAHPRNSSRSPECLSATHTERLPDPADSPYLAPSDFVFFDPIKENQSIWMAQSGRT